MSSDEVWGLLHITALPVEQDLDDSDLMFILNIVYVGLRYVLVALLVVIGLPSNGMSFLVTRLKGNHELSMSVYMATLAIVDTIVLVSLFANDMLRIAFVDGRKVDDILIRSDLLAIISTYLVHTFGMISGWRVAAMAVDRCIAVWMPLRSMALCSSSKAKKVVAMIFVGVAVPKLYVFFAYRTVVSGGVQVTSLGVPEYPFVVVIITCYNLIFGSVLPFLVVFMSNILIVYAINRASRDRKQMGSQSTTGSDGTYLTRMLISVSVGYLVCSLPYRLFRLIRESIMWNQYDMSQQYWILLYKVQFSAVFFLWCGNFSTNFFLYCLGGGTKFRSQVRKIFYSNSSNGFSSSQ